MGVVHSRLDRTVRMPADNANDHRPGHISPADRDALRQRASELGAKLEQAKHRHAPSSRGDQGRAMGQGMKAAAELIGGVVVGGVIGWFLDQWLGTRPWLFILFFMLGTAAGMLNIVRSANQQKTPPGLPSVKDDDER
jgi:ATP synthase protein I